MKMRGCDKLRQTESFTAETQRRRDFKKKLATNKHERTRTKKRLSCFNFSLRLCVSAVKDLVYCAQGLSLRGFLIRGQERGDFFDDSLRRVWHCQADGRGAHFG